MMGVLLITTLHIIFKNIYRRGKCSFYCTKPAVCSSPAKSKSLLLVILQRENWSLHIINWEWKWCRNENARKGKNRYVKVAFSLWTSLLWTIIIITENSLALKDDCACFCVITSKVKLYQPLTEKNNEKRKSQ